MMCPNSLETTEMVTFIEEILNGKLHFLCSGIGTFSQSYSFSERLLGTFSQSYSFSERLFS